MPSELDQVLNECKTILAQVQVAANQAAAYAASAANKAPLDSPALTGVPTAPTAAAGTNTDQIATTAYLDGKLGQINGIATLNSAGRVPTSQLPAAIDYQGVWDADTNTPTIVSSAGTQGYFYIVNVAGTTSIDGISSWAVGDWIVFDLGTWQKVPAFQTDPTDLPLSALADQATATIVGRSAAGTGKPSALDVATVTGMLDAFVGDSGAGGTKGLVPAPAAGDGVLPKILAADGTWVDPPTPDLSGYALLADPAFTGTPTAATAAADTNSTQLATTEFVLNQASDTNPAMDGTAAPGTSERYARYDHVHPTDTTRAPLASPALTGTPTAPTPTPGDNTTKISTTAFVAASITALNLGTAATKNVGTGANNVVQLDATSKLPAVDGSALTGINTGQPIPATNTLDVGTAAMLFYSGPAKSDGSTISGGSLALLVIAYDGVPESGATQTGTWKNISGTTLGGSYVAGLWVRIV